MKLIWQMIAGAVLIFLLTCPSYAIRLKDFEAADGAKQSQIFKESYDTAIAQTLVALRDSRFKDGKPKKAERMEKDRARAVKVEKLAGHLSDRQREALASMIEDYAEAQPDTQLEDVISGFFLQEADKP
jgi:hypothetical protein